MAIMFQDGKLKKRKNLLCLGQCTEGLCLVNMLSFSLSESCAKMKVRLGRPRVYLCIKGHSLFHLLATRDSEYLFPFQKDVTASLLG